MKSYTHPSTLLLMQYCCNSIAFFLQGAALKTTYLNMQILYVLYLQYLQHPSQGSFFQQHNNCTTVLTESHFQSPGDCCHSQFSLASQKVVGCLFVWPFCMQALSSHIRHKSTATLMIVCAMLDRVCFTSMASFSLQQSIDRLLTA